MRKYIVLTLSIMLMAFSGSAFAKHATDIVGSAAGGIVMSRHNLSSYGMHWQAHSTSTGNTSIEAAQDTIKTTQICVFCHTPHFTESVYSDGVFIKTAPLWNKKVNQTAYTTYTTAFAGQTLPGRTNTDTAPAIGGSSLACLSCHDGTMSVDMMVNAPGKDGVDTTGTGVTQGWYFFGGGKYIDGATEAGRTNLNDGANSLSNDHPISMDYPVSASVTYFSLRPTTTSFLSAGPMLSGKPTGTDAVEANIWAVNGVISDTQTINDVLRKGKVECSTCHDPHYKNRTNPDPGFVRSYTNSGDHEDMKIDGLFLRRVGGNSNSGVCRTCHAK